jgi:hypothetical protein
MASAPLPLPTSEPQHSAEPSASLDNATAIFQIEPEVPHSFLRSRPATNRLPYGQSFHDVPAYLKKLQFGEFFEPTKLLPNNLFNTADEQPVMLTLENSVVKVKPSTQSTTSITDIEKWTTVFTTYMSVFTHEFPNRAQEFLQYTSIIRHATQCHKGVGW